MQIGNEPGGLPLKTMEALQDFGIVTGCPRILLRERGSLTLARLKLGERVLDVGTGTGPTAVVAADLVGETGKVLAVDNSRGMLAVAKTKARKLGLTNLKFRLTGLTSLRLPAGSFDAVISSYGMPDLPSDIDPALAFLFMVLKPGGRLCFCEKAGEPEKLESTLRELLLRYRVARATQN